MKRTTALFIALTLFSQPLAAVAGGSIPPVTMENLAEKNVAFPQAFNSAPTLVILAFAHGQQEEADRAIALLEAAQTKKPSLSWFEFAVINNPPTMVRYFIRNGMRGAIPEARHPQVFPYFVDAEAWRAAAQVGESDEPLLAKVSVTGAILKTAPLADITSVDNVLAF